MASTCSFCGADLSGVEKCEELFYPTQVKEFEDWSYGAVHHLSVPCYMIQHNVYTKEAFCHVRALLKRFIEEDLDPQRIRAYVNRENDSRKRDFRFTKGEKEARLPEVKWSFTVADVRLDTAENYCTDVKEWALSVLRDTAHL